MTYIEIIRRGKKAYYYLTKNVRINGNKWKKIRVYTGDKKLSKEDVRRYAGEIEVQIKRNGLEKQANAYLSPEDAETLQDLKESFKVWLKRAPENIRKKNEEDFLIRFTYHTNAIEGNRLTLRQTALILKDKVIPSGIRAEDYQEVVNGMECLEFLKKYQGKLNTKLLEKVNEILTRSTGVQSSGKIRSFEVYIAGSTHIPPKGSEVKKHLSNLLKWYSAAKKKLHPFELATLVHAKIAWIHPFEDGNGRTARALMNWILLKKEYPMFFIPFERREEYYAALEDADRGDYKEYIHKMLLLIIDQVGRYGRETDDAI